MAQIDQQVEQVHTNAQPCERLPGAASARRRETEQSRIQLAPNWHHMIIGPGSLGAPAGCRVPRPVAELSLERNRETGDHR